MKRSLFPSFANRGERPFRLHTILELYEPFLSYICITLSHENLGGAKEDRTQRSPYLNIFLRDWKQSFCDLVVRGRVYFIWDMEWSSLTVECRIEEEMEFDDTLDGT